MESYEATGYEPLGEVSSDFFSNALEDFNAFVGDDALNQTIYWRGCHRVFFRAEDGTETRLAGEGQIVLRPGTIFYCVGGKCKAEEKPKE